MSADASDRSEAPTDRKIETLRQLGVVPRSICAAGLLVCAVFSIVLWVSVDSVQSWWTAYQGVVASSAEGGAIRLEGELLFDRIGSPIVYFLFLPLSIGVVVVFAVGLLQSRFLVRFDAIAFDLGRIFERGGLGGAFGRIAKISTLCFFLLGSGLILGLAVAPLAASLLLLDVHALSQVPELIVRAVAFLFGIVGVLAAIVAVVISQLEFRRVHRMTRQEREAESREHD